MAPQFRRPGKLWYVSDAFVWDDLPPSYQREPGRPLECSSKLFVFNPQRRTAAVKARFHHPDRAPTSVDLSVRPGRIECLELAKLPEVPHRQAFWVVVEASAPVLPQLVHEDYAFWDPVPDALVSVAPYPGPLEEETRWVFPDCYESDPVRGWYEYETLTILNPSKHPVSARIRYLLRHRALGGEEVVEIPGERVAQLDVWKRTPRLLGAEQGPPVHIVGDYAVRIDATGPVVAQTTRRARWVGQPSIVGARSTMGVPLRGRKPSRWYYPGGAIIDRGVLPRAKESDHPLGQCDNTWNLLFINNLDDRRKARAQVTFHGPDGSTTQAGVAAIPPLKSALECLHARPWLGKHTEVGRPFALTVTADAPVVPEITCAEFEMWSQVCPGAMSAVNFHPGPLRDERVWWLGIGRAGGGPDLQTEWSQTYHLFNPGKRKVQVVLSFLGMAGGRRKLTYAVEIAPNGVVMLESKEIEGLPVHRPFAVVAEGSGSFCAQVFVRAFTRGLPHTRSMYSMMGIPMGLEL